jgi:cyclic pyranopterin phosphate synthase
MTSFTHYDDHGNALDKGMKLNAIRLLEKKIKKVANIETKGIKAMHDSFGRNIDYMRISITDRCNLRCKYCIPEGFSMLSHDDILRYEEILRLCNAAAKSGIRSIKVTGGEPLARKGCMNFLRNVKSLPGIENVTLTTNGVLLEPLVDDLAEMKLDGVNISLDSLNPDTYKQITDSFFSNLYGARLIKQ